ncbi:MAG: hypothetical protein JW751_04130 [Polyangiaceae bacterium]|nr:hypothetical protein [Polyangiaceae bacterium]
MTKPWLLRTPLGDFVLRVARQRDSLVGLSESERQAVWRLADWELANRDPDAMAAIIRFRGEISEARRIVPGPCVEDSVIAELRSFLASTVQSGRLVFEAKPALVVRVQQGTPAPVVEPPPPPLAPTEELGSFSVLVIDEVGDPLAGVDLVFTFGRTKEQRTTDSTGTARLEDVPSSFATVSFADEAFMRQKLRERWQVARGRQWLDPPSGMTNTVVVVRRQEALGSRSFVTAEISRS